MNASRASSNIISQDYEQRRSNCTHQPNLSKVTSITANNIGNHVHYTPSILHHIVLNHNRW